MPKPKQDELPAMPEKTPLEKACDEFLSLREDLEDIAEQLDEKRKEIHVKLKDDRKTSLIYKGFFFEIFQAEEKVKVSKV